MYLRMYLRLLADTPVSTACSPRPHSQQSGRIISIRKAAARDMVLGEGTRNLLSTPLLVEAGEEEEDSDSSAIGSPLTGGNRTARGDDQRRLGGGRRQQQASSSRGAAAANGSAAATWAWAIPPARRPLGGIGGASFSRLQRGDYRSEGEQPSTERNGSRRRQRPLGEAARQDSFRTNRMPKRGGRKRLRRNLDRPAAARRRRIKIRVSSYCVARGLETLELLKWLESQPNRQ
ncbi:unnamed protein product, partial [Ectocarpus sp. 4 AP-2014]